MQRKYGGSCGNGVRLGQNLFTRSDRRKARCRRYMNPTSRTEACPFYGKRDGAKVVRRDGMHVINSKMWQGEWGWLCKRSEHRRLQLPNLGQHTMTPSPTSLSGRDRASSRLTARSEADDWPGYGVKRGSFGVRAPQSRGSCVLGFQLSSHVLRKNKVAPEVKWQCTNKATKINYHDVFIHRVTWKQH